MTDHWPLLLYIIATFGLVSLLLSLSHVLGERRAHSTTAEPFESGIVPAADASLRFPVQFYLVAVAFVIFDVEAAYLFGWAIGFRSAGWVGWLEATVFVGILLAALVYLVRVGALDWAPERRRHVTPAGRSLIEEQQSCAGR